MSEASAGGFLKRRRGVLKAGAAVVGGTVASTAVFAGGLAVADAMASNSSKHLKPTDTNFSARVPADYKAQGSKIPAQRPAAVAEPKK